LTLLDFFEFSLQIHKHLEPAAINAWKKRKGARKEWSQKDARDWNIKYLVPYGCEMKRDEFGVVMCLVFSRAYSILGEFEEPKKKDSWLGGGHADWYSPSAAWAWAPVIEENFSPQSLGIQEHYNKDFPPISGMNNGCRYYFTNRTNTERLRPVVSAVSKCLNYDFSAHNTLVKRV
jgi:hypothetical protein